MTQRVPSLQSKLSLSIAPFSGVIASRTAGSGTLLLPAVVITCSARSTSILFTAVTSSLDRVRLCSLTHHHMEGCWFSAISQNVVKDLGRWNTQRFGFWRTVGFKYHLRFSFVAWVCKANSITVQLNDQLLHRSV